MLSRRFSSSSYPLLPAEFSAQDTKNEWLQHTACRPTATHREPLRHHLMPVLVRRARECSSLLTIGSQQLSAESTAIENHAAVQLPVPSQAPPSHPYCQMTMVVPALHMVPSDGFPAHPRNLHQAMALPQPIEIGFHSDESPHLLHSRGRGDAATVHLLATHPSARELAQRCATPSLAPRNLVLRFGTPQKAPTGAWAAMPSPNNLGRERSTCLEHARKNPEP
jgi:hypothetical protein